MSAGRGTVELLLTVDAMQATRSLEAHAQALRDGEAATRAQVTAMQAAEAWLREEADAAREAARAQAELAAAQQRIQTIAASGSAGSKLALQHRREWEELSKLVQVTGSSNATQQAATAIAARQAAEVAKLGSANSALTTTTKASGAAMAGLGRQLNDVFVSLMSGASPLQVATQQGEQLGFAFKEAGGTSAILSTTLGATAAAAAGLAAQVGLGYLAWLAYTDTQREANAVAAVTARGMADLAPLTADLRDSVIDLREAVGDLTEAEADMERASIKAFDALQKATANTRAEMAKLRAEQGSVKTQIVDTVTSIGTAIYGENAPGMKVFDYLTTSSKEYQDQLDAGNGVIEEAQKQTKQLVAAKQLAIQADADEKASKAAATAATKADSEAKRRAAEAIREEERAWRELQAALKAEVEARRAEMAATMEGINAYYDAQVSVVDIGSRAIKNAQDEAIALADLAIAYSEAKISAEEYAAQVAQIQSSADTATLTTATSTVNSMSSANGVLNTVASAGPWGALIAGIIDAVKNLDQTIAGIEDLIGGVLTQIGKLPETLMNVMKYAQKDLPKQIGEAIGGLIGSLPELLASAIADILNPLTLFKVFGRLFDAILRELGISADFLKSLNSAVDAVVEWFKQLWKDIKALFGIGDKSNQKADLQAQSDSRQNSLYAGTSRTVGPSSYGGRAPGWASATVAKNNGGVGAAMSTRVRMGARNGEVTFTIQESSYADAHKSLQKRGVI